VLFDSPTAYAVGIGDDGGYLLRGWPRPGPPSIYAISPDWTVGRIYVPSAAAQIAGGIYPFQSIDTVITMLRLAATGGFLVHSAAVADGERAYLFAGPAGAGKSTMASLWASVPGALILGEDQNAVCLQTGEPWVYGTPWHLNPERCFPTGIPLVAVFLLSHGLETRARLCARAEAAAALLTNCFLPVYDRERLDAILGTLDDLVQRVPVYRLSVRPGPDVVGFVRRLTMG
jgi:hypothetical protein